MKRITLFFTAFILIAGFCKSQTAVMGNYIGRSIADQVVVTIEVKQHHHYVLKTYDPNKKLQKKVKGKWTVDGNKLVLQEKSGTITVLEKYNDTWYVAGPNGYVCLAKFYQNKDPNEFWTQLMKEGC